MKQTFLAVRKSFSLAVFALAVLALPASAGFIDLTQGSTDSGVGGTCVGIATDTCGQFFVNNAQSTGTGVIDPFYTVQNNGTEQGFNSDAPGSNPNYDMKRGSGTAFTQAIQVSAFGLVDINGNPCNAGCLNTQYIRFALDINESAGGGNEFLSIDTLQLYVKGTNDTTSTTLAQLIVGATKIYDLDGAAANTILTDYRLNNGSGSGDLLFYVPFSAFAGHTTDWLYLWGQYGNLGVITNGPGNTGCNTTPGAGFTANAGTKDCDYSSSDGFEEWARLEGPNGSPVPEPGYLLSMVGGLVLLFVYDIRRRRQNKVA